MNKIVTILTFTVVITGRPTIYLKLNTKYIYVHQTEPVSVTSNEITDVTKQKKELDGSFTELFKFVFDDIGDSNLSPRIEENEKLVFPNIISNYQKCYSCRLNPYLNKDTCEDFVIANENDTNSESNNTCLSQTDFCVSFIYHVRLTANNKSETFHQFGNGEGGLGCYRYQSLCSKEGCYRHRETFQNPFNETTDKKRLRPWILKTVDICCCKGD